MPFALIVFGAVLLVSSVRNTQADLWKLIQGDFTGQGNFIYWFLSIMAIGAVGYVEKLKPISNAFLLLVIIVLFLSKKGFFTQFQAQIASTNIKPLSSGTSLSTLSSLSPLQPLSSGLQMPDLSSLMTIQL